MVSGAGAPEFGSSPEVSISIAGGAIYDEVSHDLDIVKKSQLDKFSAKLGSDATFVTKSPLFTSIGIFIGSSCYLRDGTVDQPKAALRANFLVDQDRLNNGYLDRSSAQQLATILQQTGVTTEYQIDSNNNHRLVFKENGMTFFLNLEFLSNEDHIKSWEEFKIGQPPSRNYSPSLSLGGFYGVNLPENREEFIRLAMKFANLTQKTIIAFHKLYNIPLSPLSISISSPQQERQIQQESRGYKITSYKQDGEFHWDGTAAEPIYRDIDDLVWRDRNQEILQNRALGNRQVVTVLKDRLVFGRWAGIAAGDQQADVLIDEDIDQKDLKVKGERVVSRRHFSASFDKKLNEIMAEKTDGAINDVVIIEDLYSTSGTIVFRRNSLSQLVFRHHGEIEKGGRTMLLPGDMVLVGGGPSEQWQDIGEDFKDRFLAKGISIIYLGDRRFVKAVIAPGATDTKEVLKELAAIAMPLEQQEQIQDYIDKYIEDPSEENIPLLDQALQVVRDYQEGRGVSAAELTPETISERKPEELIRILNGHKFEAENRHILEQVIDLREEGVIVGYAFLRLLSISTPEEKVSILKIPNLWKKLPAELVLHSLDYIEESNLPVEFKKELLNRVFSARDDLIRDLVRDRLKKYPD